MVYILYPRPQKGALNYKKGMITHSRKDLIKPTIISFKDRKDKSKVLANYYYNKKKRVQVQYPKQQNNTKVFHHYQQQHVLFHHTCVSELMSGENRRETTSSFSPKNFVVVTQSLSKSSSVNRGI